MSGSPRPAGTRSCTSTTTDSPFAAGDHHDRIHRPHHRLRAAGDWTPFTERLLAISRVDPVLARLAEGHLDAIRILHELGEEPIAGAFYGVWASKSGGSGWQATPEGDGYRIEGELRFASGAGMLDRALVTVPGEDAELLLDLDVRGLEGDPSEWQTAAMRRSRSLNIRVAGDHREGHQVGAEGDYLGRWGFFPGGVGVAAVWAGGAARIVDLLEASGVDAHASDATAVRVGHVRTDAIAAVELVRSAARAYDRNPRPDAAEAAQIAALCRAGVAAAVRRVLAEARILAGPARLAFDGALATAIADLELYVAQHNDDRAFAALGRNE